MMLDPISATAMPRYYGDLRHRRVFAPEPFEGSLSFSRTSGLRPRRSALPYADSSKAVSADSAVLRTRLRLVSSRTALTCSHGAAIRRSPFPAAPP